MGISSYEFACAYLKPSESIRSYGVNNASHLVSVASHVCRITHIVNHLISWRCAFYQRIASHVVVERMSANPCGGCGVYPCGASWVK